MEGTHQQVDVTPCSNRQEGTEAFMVVSPLLSIVRGVPLTRAAFGFGKGRPTPLSGVLPYTNTEQVNYE